MRRNPFSAAPIHRKPLHQSRSASSVVGCRPSRIFLLCRRQQRELQDAAEIAAVDLLRLGQFADGCIRPVLQQPFPGCARPSALTSVESTRGRFAFGVMMSLRPPRLRIASGTRQKTVSSICGDASPLDRRVAQVRVVDPHHPLYGKCFPVSDRRSGRGPRLIVIRLPDGRERGISRSATAPTSASDDLAAAAPSCQVHISVRTLLPLANHVRAVLASRHADLEGGGGRDLDQTAERGRPESAATPVAAAPSRDTASAGAVGGTARATPAPAARPLRGGSSC